MKLGCKTFITGVFALLGFVCLAQESDSTLQVTPEKLDIPAITKVKDSMVAKDVEGQINLPKVTLDGEVGAQNEVRAPKINLGDLNEARQYDSLWLRELYKNKEAFVEMYAALQQDDDEELEVLTELPTDTLKARLARLNEKTPFNIAYNPSLENVIKSFLTRKKGLMQRMMTSSQFYFPLFEQELDNQDIPLEVKYLAIVESALNPRARSRVGAKGLWQFMFSTGKMYGLDVSSYVDERNDPI